MSVPVGVGVVGLVGVGVVGTVVGDEPVSVGVAVAVGLAWIALYYVTQSDMPVLSTLGGWNLVGGFTLIIVGVVLATRWH